jgi:ferric-dicitrate binding protein FerR (iron transport regulator)
LAPQTTLRLAQFGAQSRTVTLQGEAYFEVAGAAGTPFIVQSGSMATRVLGTAFVVRHYSDDTRARVSVTAGKVNVSSLDRHFAPVTLTAGHAADVADSTISVRTGDNVALDTRWVDGELFFHDTPLLDVLTTLHRWYGYQFRCTDPALTRQLVTVILSTRSSSASLAILEQVLSVNLTVTGDTVTLAPRPARPVHGNARMRAYDIWTPNKGAGR